MKLEENKVYIGGGYHLYRRNGDRFYERRYEWVGECYPEAWRETTLETIMATEWQYGIKLQALTKDGLTPGMYLDEGKVKLWVRSKRDEY